VASYRHRGDDHRGLFIVGAVAASASIPDSETGEITGCYANRGGALRLINAEAGKHCKSGESPVVWNVQGLPGPAGPGLTNFHVNTAQGEPEAEVYCGVGEVALGGGGFSPTNLALRVSVPITSGPDGTGTPIGWTVSNATDTGSSNVSAYVVCAQVS
jgi:hypothetical protein